MPLLIARPATLPTTLPPNPPPAISKIISPLFAYCPQEFNVPPVLPSSPYVKGKDGKVVPTEQHHSQQKGSGPIFEIKQTTHKNPTNQQILHLFSSILCL
jgi:hypothetical protein